MGKSFVAAAVLVVFVCCFSSVLARKAPKVSSVDKFFVEGKIYCDPCHFEFESRLSRPLPGIKVTLQCRNPENDKNVTYVKEGKSDAKGFYSLPVEGEHEEEVCELTAEKSADGDCTVPMPNKSDRIVLTKNMGVSSAARYVNPLGFMTETVDAQCALVVLELGLDKLDD